MTNEERIENLYEIKAIMKLGMPLSLRQRSYYLLYIATLEEAKSYLSKEKKKNEI